MNEDLQTVVSAVIAILKDTNMDPMVNAVVNRLVSFGYTPTEADAGIIAFSIQKAANHVLNETNQPVIPDGMMEITVDMACGEVLNVKFLSGQLTFGDLDLTGIVESIREGDTQVTFGKSGSAEEKVKDLISWLIAGKGCDFLCFRKMRW